IKVGEAERVRSVVAAYKEIRRRPNRDVTWRTGVDENRIGTAYVGQVGGRIYHQINLPISIHVRQANCIWKRGRARNLWGLRKGVRREARTRTDITEDRYGTSLARAGDGYDIQTTVPIEVPDHRLQRIGWQAER